MRLRVLGAALARGLLVCDDSLTDFGSGCTAEACKAEHSSVSL